jgi:mannose-1-phosphate guanylyltransferase
MKAFLLAAGHGTRMRPLTDFTPKCLLPIQGVPMLQIWMEFCDRFGITDILINIHSHANVVREFLEGRNGTRVRVSHERTLLGSAGTLLANREWIGSDSEFWIFYADVLTAANLGQILEVHRKRAQIATLGVYQVPDPHRCGIATVDTDDIVREFVEKPKTPSGSLAFSGIMVSGPEIFDFIPTEIPADIGFHVLPRLVGRMAACRITEYLLDIGTPENYQIAQTEWQGFGH